MHIPKTFLFVLIASTFAQALSSAAPSAVGSDFTIIADSTSPEFKAFGAYPSLNDRGDVAFYAELDAGGIGIYKAQPDGTTVPIANDGTGAPSINNSGEVASRRLTDEFTELYKGTGSGPLLTIARTDDFFRSFPGFTYLADTGLAVFYANRNPVSPTRRGIYVGSGNNTTTQVIDNAGNFNDFGSNPTLNNLGTVAFAGSLDTPDGGIYIGNTSGDNATAPVITLLSSDLYNFEGSPFINDNEEIAFMANEDATTARALFIINQDGTNVRKMADVGGAYSQLEAPVINNLGTFVFGAFLDAGGRGIFTGPDAVADKVIATGDALFGSTVDAVVFFRGLNNRNEIAFFYSLADGRSGIARAKLTVPTTPTRVVSRKEHGEGNPYEVDLPIFGTPGIEPRSGGQNRDYLVVFTFAAPMTFEGVSVTPGDGGTAEVAGFPAINIEGTQVFVNLTNVSNAQTLTVRLHTVNGAGDLAVPMSILIGDTNGDATVNAGDALQTRSRSGQQLDPTNFRFDVNADGLLNSGDGIIVRSGSGTSLP